MWTIPLRGTGWLALRARPVDSPVDSPWTTLRVAHRLPTGLPTGSPAFAHIPTGPSSWIFFQGGEWGAGRDARQQAGAINSRPQRGHIRRGGGAAAGGGTPQGCPGAAAKSGQIDGPGLMAGGPFTGPRDGPKRDHRGARWRII